jgi:hypothetical protein
MATQQLTDRQKDEAWRMKYAGEYTEHEMDQISRFWRSLGARIRKGARIRDGVQGKRK